MSHKTMFEQSRCSTSQFMPVRVENNLKSVKQQISDYDFELLIDIGKEALMSKVVQQVSFVGL
jgi:DNA-directed RNA polymerase-5 subunit 1